MLKEYPDYAFLHYLQGQRLLDQGLINDALVEARKATKLDPDFVDGQVFLGKLLIANSNNTEAVKVLEKVIKLDPEIYSIYPLLSRQYVLLERYSKAVSVMKRLLKVDPEAVIAHMQVGFIYERNLNNHRMAFKHYNKALELEPDNVSAHDAIAQLYLTRNELTKALVKFKEIEEHEPGNLSVSLRVALINYELKNFAAAIEKFKEVLKKDPSADKVRYYLGMLYQGLKRYDEAMQEFASVPASSVHYQDAIIRLASQLRKDRKIMQAIKVLEEAILTQPQATIFHEFLAAIYEDENNNKEAVAVLKRAHKIMPKDERVLMLLGTVFEKTKQRKKAIHWMQKVIKLNADNVTALNYVGYTFADQGKRLNRAEGMVRRALALRPGDAYITDSLGWVLFKQGRLDLAYKKLTSAIKLVPNEPTILYHLGEVSLARGNAKKAKDYFKRSIKAWQLKAEVDADELARARQRIAEINAGEDLE